MARRATAQDVADLAGVSRSAVSLVLNGRGAGNIRPAKQEAIRAAADRLRYRPDAVAISLRSQRTHTLGVLSWPGRVGDASRMLHRAHQVARERGYLLLLTDVGDDPELERHQLAMLRDRRVDGMLVVAPELTDRPSADDLLTVPTVLVNVRDPADLLTTLLPDEEAAGGTAARALLDAGHRAVGVLLGEPASPLTRLRGAGVTAALAEAGVGSAPQAMASGDVDSGYRAARRLLDGPDRPTALVCLHERLALGALLAASHLGLSVSEQLSLVSLEDGGRLAGRLVPPLTTVRRPDRQLAEEAVLTLLDRLVGAADPPERRLLDCPLVPRGSVAPPPA